MIRTVNFEVKIDTETGKVVGLEMLEGLYDRTVFVYDGDRPLGIKATCEEIEDELRLMVK